MNQPTQVQYPWRAVLRTILAVVLAATAVLNIVVPAVVNALGNSLPAEQLAWLNAAAVVVASVSGAITRIMAIPEVNEWLTKWHLSAEKN